MGGKVKNVNYLENLVWLKIKKINNSLLVKNFFGKGNINNVWMSHSDQVYKLPKGFKAIASSKNSKLTIIENNKKKLYGVQFHPEVTHTVKGKSFTTKLLVFDM